MDSITQITLGAAVGEALLGKKLGNRAMVWGAIGGTIPDLDVIANAFMSDIDALSFHRGITHSIFFAIVGGFFLGFLIDKFHKIKYYNEIALGVVISLLLGLLYSLHAYSSFGSKSLYIVSGVVVILIILAILGYKKPYKFDADVELFDWGILFFLAFLTHSLLDCFTSFGTQLFQPYYDYRVSFDSISVVDFLYTLPLLLMVVMASFFPRKSKTRRMLNYLGLSISSLYLIFTLYNKSLVQHKFQDSLYAHNVTEYRMLTNPTILNNILWNCIADVGDTVYMGSYSFFDNDEYIKLVKIPKNTQSLVYKDNNEVVDKLRWFTNDFYTVSQRDDGRLQLNDLRYGSTYSGGVPQPEDYVFKFILTENESKQYSMEEDRSSRNEEPNDLFQKLIDRIKGNQ